MDRGYVCVWRKLLDSGVMKSPVLFTFKMWCILRASWKGHAVWMNGQEVELKPGEFIFGRNAACEGLGLSPKQVRNCVRTCLQCGFIRASKRASKYTIYSVVNWDVYQYDPDERGQQEGQEKGQQRASTRAPKGPAEGQHKGHIQEGKNVRSNTSSRPSAESKAFSYFVAWWVWAYEVTEGRPYLFEAGKDGKHVKDLLRIARDPAELLGRACNFLLDRDPFYRGKKTLGLFRSQVNKYNGDVPAQATERGISPPGDMLWSGFRPWEQGGQDAQVS
jgi:hypothetical protein